MKRGRLETRKGRSASHKDAVMLVSDISLLELLDNPARNAKPVALTHHESSFQQTHHPSSYHLLNSQPVTLDAACRG